MKHKINQNYVEARKKAYPSITEQLDMLYHDPEKWRETIKAIKDSIPKDDG